MRVGFRSRTGQVFYADIHYDYQDLEGVRKCQQQLMEEMLIYWEQHPDCWLEDIIDTFVENLSYQADDFIIKGYRVE